VISSRALAKTKCHSSLDRIAEKHVDRLRLIVPEELSETSHCSTLSRPLRSNFASERCQQWCREVPTMVPYSVHRRCCDPHLPARTGFQTLDYEPKERRRKPQGRWSLRRQFSSVRIAVHRIAPKVRETGVEPARVSPLDPKCRKFTFLLHRAHGTFGWQPLMWQ